MTENKSNTLRKRDILFNKKTGLISLILLYIIWIIFVSVISNNIILYFNGFFQETIYLFIKIMVFLIFILPVLLYFLCYYLYVNSINNEKMVSGILLIITPIFITFFFLGTEDIKEVINNSLEKIPEVTLHQKEKVEELQNNGEGVNIYGTGSIEAISFNILEGETDTEFYIKLINNSDLTYGSYDNGFSKKISIVFPKQDITIDGNDLNISEYVKPVESDLVKNSTSDKIYFELNNVGKTEYIKLFLRYNGNTPLDNTNFKINLFSKVNVGIVNSSGKDYLSTDYYEKIKFSNLGYFGLERINNHVKINGEYTFPKESLFTENEIFYFEDKYLSLAESINKGILESPFNIRQISKEDCYEYIYDNRIEFGNYEYKYKGDISSSDYSLCESGNIILNLINK